MTPDRGGAHISLDDHQFERVSRLVFDLTGISLQPSRKEMIAARLSRLLRGSDKTSIEEYCTYIRETNPPKDTSEFISAITTNMTKFFREPHHFEQVAEWLRDRASMGAGPIKFWSAGCSTGEEAYSLAMTCIEHAQAPTKVQILATDIDARVLHLAKQGVYHNEAIEPHFKDKYAAYMSDTGEDKFEISDAAKKLVVFRKSNLNARWTLSTRFHLIMCRNVAIYFSAKTQASLWHRLSEQLTSDGMLIIGHSEAIADPAHIGLSHLGRGVYVRTGTTPN